MSYVENMKRHDKAWGVWEVIRVTAVRAVRDKGTACRVALQLREPTLVTT